MAASASQLRSFKRRLARDLGPQHVYVLDAHLLMLKDRMFLDRVAKIIRGERVNAEWALQQVVARFREAFAAIEDSYLREKAGDMEDIGQRVLRNLVGESAEQVTSEAMKILGSQGYLSGNSVEQAYRCAKYGQIAGTSTEIARVKIGDMAMGLRN